MVFNLSHTEIPFDFDHFYLRVCVWSRRKKAKLTCIISNALPKNSSSDIINLIYSYETAFLIKKTKRKQQTNEIMSWENEQKIRDFSFNK